MSTGTYTCSHCDEGFTTTVGLGQHTQTLRVRHNSASVYDAQLYGRSAASPSCTTRNSMGLDLSDKFNTDVSVAEEFFSSIAVSVINNRLYLSTFPL